MTRTVDLLLTARETPLVDGVYVRRALPRRELRRIGGFVFFDHFNARDITPKLFDVPPHPHVGLQTVTYLFSGEILHTDSMNSEQLITPGDVNWMTAGKGVTHAEQVVEDLPVFHGIQTWVGLPHKFRKVESDFNHFASDTLPYIEKKGINIRVLAGELENVVSPIPTFQELTYLDIEAESEIENNLSVNPEHELGIYIAEGKIRVGETEIERGVLAKLSDGESSLSFQALENSRFVVFGGEVLPDPTIIYWNFITDSLEEAKEKMAEWEAGKFPKVEKYIKR